MKSNRFTRFFNTRALKYGGYAALLTAGFLGLLVAINVLADAVPLRADLTVERYFTLSEETHRVLDGLGQSVTFISLYEEGKEDSGVVELLNKYRARSSRIALSNINPYRSPRELKRYAVDGQEPELGSIVVDSGDRFKVIKSYEMYEYAYDEETLEARVQSFQAEKILTSAIVYVTARSDPVIYLVKGHGEAALSPTLVTSLQQDNFLVKDLNITTAGGIPGDASILVFVSPKTDLSFTEAREVDAHLRGRGGRAVFLLDLSEAAYPNRDGLLASYGLEPRTALVIERDAANFLPNQPFVLVPNLAEHVITRGLEAGDMPVIFPLSQVLNILEIRKRKVTVEPLLVTSGRSWAQVDMDSDTTQKVAGDYDGPFAVAVAVTDAGEAGELESRIVVTASSQFLFPPENIGYLPENETFFRNCMNWLQGADELIAITPRSISSIRYKITLSSFQFYLYAGLAVLLVPGLILGMGLATFLRRRHL
jgi:ABC-type uncharacterized transport system involved in gliding motility auxiliary subunit